MMIGGWFCRAVVFLRLGYGPSSDFRFETLLTLADYLLSFFCFNTPRKDQVWRVLFLSSGLILNGLIWSFQPRRWLVSDILQFFRKSLRGRRKSHSADSLLNC